MDTPAWSSKIDNAQSAGEVSSLVRQYLASRAPADLAILPRECAPDRALSPEEIADCAYRLAAYHSHDEGLSRVIQRIGSILSRASIRLAELARRESEGSA